MRLATEQVDAVRRTAQQLVGAGARARMFRSAALDDCKIDIILKDANTTPAWISEIAKRAGTLI